jgi:putative transposase
MRYRRAQAAGGTFFFTLVTHDRRRFLCQPQNVTLLRAAFRYVMARHSFKVEAFALLPDHLHCIWTLPTGDSDFSGRWRLVKGYFTRGCDPTYRGCVSASRERKGEQAAWQRRFWEHQIRDEGDLIRHMEYVHYNPVKHGLVSAPREWPHSSFHRYVRAGVYAEEWGAGEEVLFEPGIGSE